MNFLAPKIKNLLIGFGSLLVMLASLESSARASILGTMGVNVGENNTTTYAMATRTAAWSTGNGVNISGKTNSASGALYYNIEDQNDNAALSGFDGPRYGGQDYDAEFLGVLFSGTKISIGILTGQRFDNGVNNYSPGDILIRTSIGNYWIEVGGSGAGAADGIIARGENGSSYALDSSGHTMTSGVSSSTQITAGMILKNPAVINAVPAFNPAVPVQINAANTDLSKTQHYMADSYSYTFYSGSQHAGIEVMFDTSIFVGGVTIQGVEWRPSCGNDEVLYVGMNRSVTPEPASFLVWGGLALAVGGFSYRRRSARLAKPSCQVS